MGTESDWDNKNVLEMDLGTVTQSVDVFDASELCT